MIKRKQYSKECKLDAINFYAEATRNLDINSNMLLDGNSKAKFTCCFMLPCIKVIA